MPPVLSQTGSTALDQIPPVGYIKMSANKQHRLHCTNINTMVWRMCILNWGIQWHITCMDLAYTARIPRHFYDQPTKIIGTRNIHLPYHPIIGTGNTHLILHRHLKCPGCMCKAYLNPVKDKLNYTFARWLGWTVIISEALLYSQHIKGTSVIIK